MNVIGIDLGTTNSEVAILEDGRPKVLEIDGSCLVPSVVSLTDDGDALIGEPALNAELLAPDRTVRWIKRHMGSGRSLELAGRVWSPAMVSSRILAYLKHAAENYLDTAVGQAVITVPAFFDEQAREDTRQAAELAGLEVLRLLNEPTAAAAAYAIGGRQAERWLIYDLGGGTFDVSIVDCSPDVMEVLASHGDTHLGGHDIDLLLAHAATEAFAAEHGIDLTEDPRTWTRVLRAAEAAKIRLSTEARAEVREEYITSRDGVDLHLAHPIDRAEFETLISPTLERSLLSVDTALREAACEPGDLARVILVGGATRTPLVAELLRQRLGIEPQGWLDPDRVVARGAAVEAAALAGVSVGSEMVDITPHSLGTVVRGQDECLYNHILIRRNTPLPCVGTAIFYKHDADQARIEVDVLQGESPHPEHDHAIGRFVVEGLDASPELEVHCRFELDRSALLRVTVEHMASGISAERMIEQGRGATRRAEIGELAAVRLDEAQPVRSEADTPDDTALPAASEEATEPAEGTGASVGDPDLDPVLIRARELLTGEDLTAADRDDLERHCADFRAGEQGARERLADLLYFLE